MNRLVIMQPSYIPWIGLFDQVEKADTFIFLDDVQYTKNDWRNRNRIKTPQGVQWLTVPVNAQKRLSTSLMIKDVTIQNSEIFKTHGKMIELNYKKAEYFNEVFPFIKRLLLQPFTLLSDYNIALTKELAGYLGIKNVQFLKSSDLPVTYKNPTDRLIQLAKKVNASHYLSGNSAKDYLQEEKFIENNIILEYHNYAHPTYTQLWGDFIPYLSIIDLLLNEGKNALRILKNEK